MVTSRRNLILLYVLSTLFMGISFFGGYCWNWWAQTPLGQYLFQSLCPISSDEARYTNLT